MPLNEEIRTYKFLIDLDLYEWGIREIDVDEQDLKHEHCFLTHVVYVDLKERDHSMFKRDVVKLVSTWNSKNVMEEFRNPLNCHYPYALNLRVHPFDNNLGHHVVENEFAARKESLDHRLSIWKKKHAFRWLSPKTWFQNA